MDKKGFGGKVFDRSGAIIVSVPFKRYSLYYITGNNCKYVVANNYYTKYRVCKTISKYCNREHRISCT